MTTLNPDGSLTITGASPSALDNYQAIQDAIDFMATTYGSGKIWLPQPGGYKTSAMLTIKNGVQLIGHGRAGTMLSATNDTGVLYFDGSANYAGVYDLFIVGTQSAASGSNTITVADNAPVNLARCTIWGGNSALLNKGIDGTIEDCYIGGWKFASVVSNGANWYKRVKIDTAGVPCGHAFYQGTPVPGKAGAMENSFDECDFSGEYSSSLTIADGNTNTAYSSFTNCIFSSSINLQQARHTQFGNCAFGSAAFNRSGGTCNIVGSYAYAPISAPGASKAGNTNIS